MIEKLRITPRPWEIRQDRNTGIPYVFAHGRIFEDTSQPRTGMSIENGFLIAAATDMLEALIDQCLCSEDAMIPLSNKDSCIILIEKATGKTWREVKALMEDSNE